MWNAFYIFYSSLFFSFSSHCNFIHKNALWEKFHLTLIYQSKAMEIWISKVSLSLLSLSTPVANILIKQEEKEQQNEIVRDERASWCDILQKDAFILSLSCTCEWVSDARKKETIRTLKCVAMWHYYWQYYYYHHQLNSQCAFHFVFISFFLTISWISLWNKCWCCMW